MEGSARLKNISENLAIAASLVGNTSGVAIPGDTLASIQSSLVDQVSSELKAERKALKSGIDVKILQITQAASKQVAVVKDDLEKFKTRYQQDQFKNLGYIGIDDDGLYMVSSSSENW